MGGRLIAGIACAGAVLVAGAGAAVVHPAVQLTAIHRGGKVVRVKVVGTHWLLSAECPDALPLTLRVRGTSHVTTLGSVRLQRPSGRFLYTWTVPSRLRGRTVTLTTRERCVSATAGSHVFTAWASLRLT